MKDRQDLPKDLAKNCPRPTHSQDLAKTYTRPTQELRRFLVSARIASQGLAGMFTCWQMTRHVWHIVAHGDILLPQRNPFCEMHWNVIQANQEGSAIGRRVGRRSPHCSGHGAVFLLASVGSASSHQNTKLDQLDQHDSTVFCQGMLCATAVFGLWRPCDKKLPSALDLTRERPKESTVQQGKARWSKRFRKTC